MVFFSERNKHSVHVDLKNHTILLRSNVRELFWKDASHFQRNTFQRLIFTFAYQFSEGQYDGLLFYTATVSHATFKNVDYREVSATSINQ